MKHLSTHDVLTRYGISRATLYRWQENPKINFPSPLKIGLRTLWREVELDAFDQMISDNRKHASGEPALDVYFSVQFRGMSSSIRFIL